MIILKSSFVALALLTPALHLPSTAANARSILFGAEAEEPAKEESMQLQYLEIVSSDVDTTCSVLAKVHGVTFGEPDMMLGNARTAALKTGGRISVRAPMAEHDKPIVRPYVLVDSSDSAVEVAEQAGGEFAMRTTEIPGHGKFAIYFLAGTQFGLWETTASKTPTKEQDMLVQYLEIVSADVDATCNALAKVHGVTFGEPDAGLGNARTAALTGGGRIGVRAPMAEHDAPIVRPYILVDDIEASIKVAEKAGAQFAMHATEIPGQGKFAIYFVAGTQFGLWEK